MLKSSARKTRHAENFNYNKLARGALRVARGLQMALAI
jgi:hypothetical protein